MTVPVSSTASLADTMGTGGTYYQILGVEPSAKEGDIRQAYISESVCLFLHMFAWRMPV
jgi:hypothetical protein